MGNILYVAIPSPSWASLVAQMIKNLPAMQEMWVGDVGLIPGFGRFPGEGNGYSLQYLCLENSMDRGTSWATVYGVSNSQTQLSDFSFFKKIYLFLKSLPSEIAEAQLAPPAECQ